MPRSLLDEINQIAKKEITSGLVQNMWKVGPLMEFFKRTSIESQARDRAADYGYVGPWRKRRRE